MSSRQAWIDINKELQAICEKMVARLSPRVERDELISWEHIVVGFFKKGTRTLRATNILIEDGLWEQAQILARVLFELRVNVDCFVIMAAEDDVAVCHRVIDSMMLEKIKQLEASNYAGLDMLSGRPTRQDFQKTLKEIQSCYLSGEIAKLRKYGFTGLSIENRAKRAGHEDAYQIVYRNFSRNVHSTDYVEHLGGPSITGENFHREYVDSRDTVTLYVAHFSAGGIAEFTNFALRCDMDAELDEIGRKQKMLREKE